jgi:hypothetical protein
MANKKGKIIGKLSNVITYTKHCSSCYSCKPVREPWLGCRIRKQKFST